MKKNHSHIRKTIVVILAAYAAVSAYATFPLIFKVNKVLYGGGTDPLAWIWRFWWLHYSAFHAGSPQSVTLLIYPFGGEQPLVYPFWDMINRWLAIAVGEIAAYNLQIIASFFLSALAMCGLIYYFTKNFTAAFFAGFVFTLSPYHFARSWDHLCLSNMHWMVLYILSLFNAQNEKTFRSAFLCGVSFGLIGLFSNFYYVYFMIIFTVLFAGFNIYRPVTKDRVALREVFLWGLRGAVGAMIGGLLILPQVWPFLKKIFFSPGSAQTTGLVRSFGQLFADAARPLNYILPAVYNPLLGWITKPFVGTIFYGDNSGGEQSLYLGIVPLTLAFIGYKRWKKKKLAGTTTPEQDFVVSFFVFCFFAFIIISMSPYWGNPGGFFIPFPSYFLYKIFPMFRNYARFGVLVMLSVCVLAGGGLKDILEDSADRKKRALKVALVFGLVLLEFLNIPPFHVTDVSTSPEVYQWLRQMPAETVIAEYPLEADERPYLFYQRIHQKKMINGAIPGTYAYEVRQKILNLERETTPGILSFLGAKYVVVHEDLYRNYEGGGTLGRVPDMGRTAGYIRVKDFADVAVYEVKAEPLDPKKVVLVQAPETILPVAEEQIPFDPVLVDAYKITFFGIIPLGDLELSRGKPMEFDGRKLIPLRAKFLKNRIISFLVDADVALESLFDARMLAGYRYREIIRVGTKLREKIVLFDQSAHCLSVGGRKIAIEENTRDPLSLLAALAAGELSAGKKMVFFMNPGKSNYRFSAVVKGKETVVLQKKRNECWRIEGDFYKIKETENKMAFLTLWIDSADKKIVKLTARTKWGVIEGIMR
ncbi:MAG: DUF3108 domain-containing protein [Candidatus Omnitrophica bacterium]|nr:DUF3108 domain-containing protein [Candidatus Omnitrophota bacterium]